MRTFPLLALVLALAACAAGDAPPTPALGNRIRFRVEGRGAESTITSARYHLLFVVRDASGRRVGLGLHAPEYADSASVAGALAAKIESVFATDVHVVETRRGSASHCEEIELPPGFALCFEPGCHYAYRIGGRREPDLEPEIRVEMLAADGSRYVPLRPTRGTAFGPDDALPHWPPPGVQ
jgi:hypothetical protein